MTTETIPTLTQGSCQCGKVNIRFLGQPSKVVACHCSECQKLSTSAFSISSIFNEDDIEIQGEMKEWSITADNGNTVTAKFCKHCGNRIYHFNPDKPEEIKFKLTSLIDQQPLIPTVHIWTIRKQDWVTIPSSAKVFSKQL